jgi:hypothetical protein
VSAHPPLHPQDLSITFAKSHSMQDAEKDIEPRESSDYDSAWKEALHRHLRLALELLFPHVAEAIDWGLEPEFLDTELRQIYPDSEEPDRRADVLVKVRLNTGEELGLLLHVEVQNQKDPEFERRMFVYHYRLTDRYHLQICSLAVLGDDNKGWRPSSYTTEVLGCRNHFEFNTKKLLDFSSSDLKDCSNPFSLVVAAQLRANKAPFGTEKRKVELFDLVRRLLLLGMEKEEVRSFFEVLDWILKLTSSQALQFRSELAEYEKEINVAYISSIEQIGLEQGLEKGLEKGLARGEVRGLQQGVLTVLEGRFGTLNHELVRKIESVQNSQELKDLMLQAVQISTLEVFPLS